MSHPNSTRRFPAPEVAIREHVDAQELDCHIPEDAEGFEGKEPLSP